MHISNLIIENFRCFGDGSNKFELPLKPGLTALVGENDAGKSAVIDALRFVLGTTDQEWFSLDDPDFYCGETSREIRIVCKYEKLTEADKRAFVEYLTYGEIGGDEPVLYINWTAKDTGETRRGQPYRRVETRSGKNGDGPTFVPEVRDLLRATYLRPLRDAEEALSAGRGSRLSQILKHTNQIKTVGVDYDPKVDPDPKKLNVLGIGDFANALLERQAGIVDVLKQMNSHLVKLSLNGEELKSSIKVSGTGASDSTRLRQLLEKLDLSLFGKGKLGLGSDSLLFMACELLLLAEEENGNKLLLIEEPEAHLHAQRQLQVMRFLQTQAKENNIQVIVTTHSPNLASAIELNNIVMIRKHNDLPVVNAFSMAEGNTKLESSDYRFLQRFLDATKANLFFARGVVIVEGDAENILLPALAKLLDRDFTSRGVSIVNVGGVGLRRYARIFQRKEVEKYEQLDIPVACVSDMDVMPDCAPVIIGRLKDGESLPGLKKRRWRAKVDFKNPDALTARRNDKESRASGQFVKTFISDEWTFEYDLALGPKDKNGKFSGGLAEDVFVAACLADSDEEINVQKKRIADVEGAAVQEFAKLKTESTLKDKSTAEEVLASNIYAKFVRDGVSKTIAAQYLAERLQRKMDKGELTPDGLRTRLPKYLTAAIDYVAVRSAETNLPDNTVSQ